MVLIVCQHFVKFNLKIYLFFLLPTVWPLSEVNTVPVIVKSFSLQGDILLTRTLSAGPNGVYLIWGGVGEQYSRNVVDHYTFLGNCPLTPSLSQHVVLSEK